MNDQINRRIPLAVPSALWLGSIVEKALAGAFPWYKALLPSRQVLAALQRFPVSVVYD